MDLLCLKESMMMSRIAAQPKRISDRKGLKVSHARAIVRSPMTNPNTHATSPSDSCVIHPRKGSTEARIWMMLVSMEIPIMMSRMPPILRIQVSD